MNHEFHPGEQPTADQVRAAREASGLSQAAAARLVHMRYANSWSQCERGVARMSPATWHLFVLLTKTARQRDSRAA